MVKLRRAGTCPFSWITDASAAATSCRPIGAADFILSVAGLYRADLWQRSRYYFEVWTDSGRSPASSRTTARSSPSASIRPVASPASPLPTKPPRTSTRSRWQARRHLLHRRLRPGGCPDRRRPRAGTTRASGAGVEAQLPSPRNHRRTDRGIRFADEAEESNDRRALHIPATVEAEAMPARPLRELLREEIEMLLPRTPSPSPRRPRTRNVSNWSAPPNG